MIRILLVEDQQILLDALADALSLEDDIRVIAKTTDSSLVMSLVENMHPDLVLMDICSEGGTTGLSETKKIKDQFPEVKVILMTAMPDLTFVQAAREAGADSFIYKTISKNQMVKSIQQTMQNYSNYPAEQSVAVPSEFDLTDREMDILRLVCKGKNRKEIADTLFLAENTVRNNINRILSKSGYDSIAKLAIAAVSKGFIVPDNSDDEN